MNAHNNSLIKKYISINLFVFGSLSISFGVMVFGFNQFGPIEVEGSTINFIILRSQHPFGFLIAEIILLTAGVTFYILSICIYFYSRINTVNYNSVLSSINNLRPIKFIAILLIVNGLTNLAIFPICFYKSYIKELYFLVGSIFGAWMFLIGIGILKRRITAWKHGFIMIGISPILFTLLVMANTKSTSNYEKTILIALSFIGSMLVGVYWANIWSKQKQWFISAQNPSEK